MARPETHQLIRRTPKVIAIEAGIAAVFVVVAAAILVVLLGVGVDFQ